MPLVASLALLVAAVRARGLDLDARATISPTAALLLLLVASSLADSLVMLCFGGKGSAGRPGAQNR